jgi:mannose-6-phosphate isomerase-like protein (cupin superfamily)
MAATVWRKGGPVQVRRVVTGMDQGGKSVFVSDERVDPITVSLMPGLDFLNLWGGDGTPTLPADGTRPSSHAYFPPAGGYRFVFVTLPPDRSLSLPADLDLAQAMAEANEKLPGMMEHIEPNNPGMHTTDTVDLDLVLSGEVDLELDDGAEVHLTAGDCVIQNGTRHAWHNRSSEPCRMLSVLIGAARQS